MRSHNTIISLIRTCSSSAGHGPSKSFPRGDVLGTNRQQPENKRTVGKAVSETKLVGNSDVFHSTYAQINEALFGRLAAGGQDSQRNDIGCKITTHTEHNRTLSQPDAAIIKRTFGAANELIGMHQNDKAIIARPVPDPLDQAALPVSQPAFSYCVQQCSFVNKGSAAGNAGIVNSSCLPEALSQDSLGVVSSPGVNPAHITLGIKHASDRPSGSHCLGNDDSSTATGSSTTTEPQNTAILQSILSYPLHLLDDAPASALVMPPVGGTAAYKVPSVGTILEETKSEEDKQRLEAWKARMIKELGLAGFQRLNEETLRNGSALHANIEKWLIDDRSTIIVAQPNLGHWRSLMTCDAMSEISSVQATEQKLEHDHLCYKGVVDCVASYRGIPSMIEWKTSKKPKRSLASAFDYPLQVAAYMGIWNRIHYHNQQSAGGRPVEQGVLVVMYENGDPADVLIMRGDVCEHYWYAWLVRLHAFWANRLQQRGAAADDRTI